MRLVIRPRKILILLYCSLIILPFFSSEIGIVLQEGKISISDFLMIFFLLYLTMAKATRKDLYFINAGMKWWITLIILWVIMIPIGIMNGGSFGESIRLVRNILYIPITYYVLRRFVKNGEENILLIILSFAVGINTIINSLVLYEENGWFMFYRANGVLNTFLFCYLLFEVTETEKFRDNIAEVAACLTLFVAACFSQERTQLITMAISCFFVFIIWFRDIGFVRIDSKKLLKRIILLIVALLIIIVAFHYILQLDVIKKYVDYYFTYRLHNGNLFKDGGISSDQSAQARVLQVRNIILMNRNPVYFFMGRGTCSYYFSAQGMTYIVDSAILWIFKDLGIIGVLVIMCCVFNMLKINKCSRHYYSLIAGGLSLAIFMIYNPSFVYTVSVGFSIGLFYYLKSIK